MASGDRKLECSLCLEKFKDPRILSCFHSYCRECLGDYVAKSKRVETSFTKFDCPICRACITLPANGIIGLQRNFYLDHDSESNHPLCRRHKSEDLRFYCRECCERICRDCKVISHEGHTIGMADDIATEMRNELDETFTDIERAINVNEIRQRAVIETLSMVGISTRMVKNDVDQLFVFTKKLFTPCIESKKRQACIIEKAYAEKLDQLNGYRLMLTEADSKDGRDIYQIHNDFKNQEKDILKLKEPPLSLESKDSDEGSLDHSKMLNMFDKLRDNIHQATIKFKHMNFSNSRKNKSVSAKRLPSLEEGEMESIPLKKLKESDVRDASQEEVHGSKGTKTSVTPSSTCSQPDISKDVKSLFTNLPNSVKPTHEVKPVIFESIGGLKTAAATISSYTNKATNSSSQASETFPFRSNNLVIPSKPQGHSVNKASNLLNVCTNIDTSHMEENKRSNSSPSMRVAAAPRLLEPDSSIGVRQNTNHSDDRARKAFAANGADNECKTIDPSKVELKSGTFQEGEAYLVKHKTGQERKMTFTAGRLVDVARYVPTTTSSARKVIEGSRVELKGGGAFETGKLYLVQNKTGEKKKMIWTGTTLMELIVPLRRDSLTLPVNQMQKEETRSRKSDVSNQGTSGKKEVSSLTSAPQPKLTSQNVQSRSSTPDDVKTVGFDLQMTDSSNSDSD